MRRFGSVGERIDAQAVDADFVVQMNAGGVAGRAHAGNRHSHGHEIAKHIQRTSDEVLRLEHGSLYPALHRLEKKGWLASKWDTHREHNRECKYYRLTPEGKKQLAAAESRWKRLQVAIARVMNAAVRA